MRRGVIAALFVAGCFPSLDGYSSGGLSGVPEAGVDGALGVPDSSASTTEGGALIDAEAGAEAEAPDAGPKCTGTAGATMVHVANSSFCIDTTEVTYRQYAEFYKASPQPDPLVCAFKTGYTAPGFLAGNAAIGDVDWCDAYQYCKWAGKRLCGGINGMKLDLSNSLSATNSEWQFACTHGGDSSWPYPYGKSANASICLYYDSPNSGQSRDVASNTQCQGPEGIFDMSGNVWEWEDACDRTEKLPRAKADCNLRGGGFLRPSSDWGSCANVPGGWARESHVADTGIRCCSDFK